MSSVDPTRPDTLSLPEMLRVMDVATAIRQDRELVEAQLNLDELKARLRDRMLAASKVTGEEVTPEEVDTAIGHYYGRLHEFHEPPWGLNVALAHLWVRRAELLRKGGWIVGAAALIWWLFLWSSGPLTITGRSHRRAEKLATEIDQRAKAVAALARSPSITTELARLTAEADTYRKQDDAKRLESVRSTLDDLESKLNEEYTITVDPAPKGKSAIDRFFHDKGNRLPSYYLIVRATTADGRVLKRAIHNDETDVVKTVTTWGERVPEEVYNRLKKDKQADGILNETAFAVKRRGFVDEEITMPGADGKPLTRMGRITEW